VTVAGLLTPLDRRIVRELQADRSLRTYFRPIERAQRKARAWLKAARLLTRAPSAVYAHHQLPRTPQFDLYVLTDAGRRWRG